MSKVKRSLQMQGVQLRMVNFFRIFCFVAIFDLVHDVEAIFHFPLLLKASGNIF